MICVRASLHSPTFLHVTNCLESISSLLPLLSNLICLPQETFLQLPPRGAEDGWKMAREDETRRRASKPVATLLLLVRDSVEAPFQETEQGIEIFPRDDFYFGRGGSWYLPYITLSTEQKLIEQYFQLHESNYI
jgi:hypothetical protein